MTLRRQAPLLLLLSLTLHPTHSIDSSILITPTPNSTLIKDRLFLTPWDVKPPIIIKSDIPVSLLRYAHSDMVTGSNVIDQNEMYVYVTTNCPDVYDNIQFRKNKDDEFGYVNKLVIRNKGEENVTGGFLPESAFDASWNYTSFWCEAGYGNRKLDTKRIRGDTFSPPRSLNVFSDTSCSIMAEILYDGCNQDLKIHAPLVKINDVTLDGIQDSETEEKCKTHYDAPLKTTNSDEVKPEEGDLPVTPERRFDSECDVVVEGRPFVDAEGRQVQADAQVMNEACWSKTTTSVAPVGSTAMSEQLSSDWTQRGLGEHASIASFAAFTISLMTNNAPPDLIRDALLAALDEVNHATVSFDMASLLSQQIIEPGALPPSSHDFATDVGSLLKGTFEEGCRDETMSALKAAMEAEETALCEEDCEMRQLLSDKLRTIAVDEARHAALAWRTMWWGCGVDEESCRIIATSYASLEQMWKEMEKRSSTALSEEVKKNWERIHEVLMPLVTGRVTIETSGIDCSGEVSLEGDFVEEVTNRVIHEVVCGKGDGSSASGSVTKTTVEVE